MNERRSPKIILRFAQIYKLLFDLGLEADGTHFYLLAYAIYLVVQRPMRLFWVSKWLYPEVAAHYKLKPEYVRFHIRVAVSLIWDRSAPRLEKIAGYAMECMPTETQCLTILARYFLGNDAA